MVPVSARDRSCAGCGTQPTDADIRFFVVKWLGQQTYRELVRTATFPISVWSIRADGDGLKSAVAFLAG